MRLRANITGGDFRATEDDLNRSARYRIRRGTYLASLDDQLYGVRMLTRYFWMVVGFVIVAITKYLTSIGLRSLAEKMQRERHDASELRRLLLQAEEKGNALQSDAETLQTKLGALKNVVGNIERSVQRYQRGGGGEETPKDEAVQAR